MSRDTCFLCWRFTRHTLQPFSLLVCCKDFLPQFWSLSERHLLSQLVVRSTQHAKNSLALLMCVNHHPPALPHFPHVIWLECKLHLSCWTQNQYLYSPCLWVDCCCLSEWVWSGKKLPNRERLQPLSILTSPCWLPEAPFLLSHWWWSQVARYKSIKH